MVIAGPLEATATLLYHWQVPHGHREILCRSCALPGQDIQMLGIPRRSQRELLPMLLQSVRGWKLHFKLCIAGLECTKHVWLGAGNVVRIPFSAARSMHQCLQADSEHRHQTV